MIQTALMLAAAIQLVAVACLINAHTVTATLIYQFCPVVLALGLMVFAVGRFMGWPV